VKQVFVEIITIPADLLSSRGALGRRVLLAAGGGWPRGRSSSSATGIAGLLLHAPSLLI
jgi:hypothetical protein